MIQALINSSIFARHMTAAIFLLFPMALSHGSDLDGDLDAADDGAEAAVGAEWVWRNMPPTKSNLYAVAWGNGLFIAVGEHGTMLSSPNGYAWTVRASGTSFTIRDVIFADDHFLAITSGEEILRSEDDYTILD